MGTLREIPEGLNEALIRKAFVAGVHTRRTEDKRLGRPPFDVDGVEVQRLDPKDVTEPEIQGTIAMIEVVDAARGRKGKR